MIKSLIISSKIILKQNSYINTEKVYVLFKITYYLLYIKFNDFIIFFNNNI